jgi:hypothetical protein
VYIRQSNGSILSVAGSREGETANEIDERFRRVMAMQGGGQGGVEQSTARGLALGQLAT